MFKVNNRNTRTRCTICSKLTIKTPKRRHWRRSGVSIVDFEHCCSSVPIVNFEPLNAGWEKSIRKLISIEKNKVAVLYLLDKNITLF